MVIPRFVEAALNNQPLKVYGDGQQSRCFCHVKDVVRALMMLLNCKNCYGGIFNIGSEESVSIERLAQLVIKYTQSKSGIEFIPYDVAYAAGFEDMRRRFPDISQINQLVGWKPELTLQKIITDVASHLKNK